MNDDFKTFRRTLRQMDGIRLLKGLVYYLGGYFVQLRDADGKPQVAALERFTVKMVSSSRRYAFIFRFDMGEGSYPARIRPFSYQIRSAGVPIKLFFSSLFTGILLEARRI